MREYKSGTKWCLWRWKVLERSNNYITRLHLVQTPWFSVCLHWINAPDPEPYLHDHPVSFLSVILHGGYREIREQLHHREFHWLANYVRATDKHRIIEVLPHTLTLCFMGPRVREWGFWTNDGWEHWRSYYEREIKPNAGL